MILLLAAGLALALAVPVRAEIGIQEVVSPGGIRAWLYEDRSIPMLNIEASFRGGATLDPAGQEGVVSLMAALLGQGAGELDATAFAETRELLAARLRFRAGRDSVRVSAQMLSESRAATLELLRQALVAPRFDPEPVERLRRQRLSGLRAEATHPNALAARAFRETVFPGDHPYARPVEGTLESVPGLDAAALRAAHGAALARDRLQVAVVGDIGAAELGPLLDAVFGGLPEAGAPLPAPAEVVSPGGVTLVDLDIPQTVVLFGQIGIPRDDPDFIAAYVMNHMLGGGGFAGRLMQEVRERRGLSYGISTRLASDDLAWLLMGRFSTGNARAAEALAVVRDEWRRMAEGGVSEAELAAAKRYLTGAYPLRFDGNGRIAEQLIQMQVDGRPIGWVNQRNALVEAVTVEDVARVARRLLQPDALTVVLVGRPAGLGAEPVINQ
jgi:zinc protease